MPGMKLEHSKKLFSRSRCGFTLIELLVVVLIIAILAAVALPQYNKAVEKSRAAQGMALVRAFGQAASVEYLRTGAHVTNLSNLDVELSEEKKAEFVCSSIASACDKKEWGVASYNATDGVKGVVAWRTNGLYKGGGFGMYYVGAKPNTLYCIERITGPNAIQTPGSYCEKIMKATRLSSSSGSVIHYYRMP